MAKHVFIPSKHHKHVVENVKGAPKARHTMDVMIPILSKYGRNASAERANGRRVGLAVASSVHVDLFCQGCESVDPEVVGDAQDWQQLLFLSPRCGLTPNELGICTTNDARLGLRLTGSSANVAVRFSVKDSVINRFLKEVPSCVSVRFSPLLELEALGVMFCVPTAPRLHFLIFLCGFLLFIFRNFWCFRRRTERFGCRRDVHCRRLRLLWCFDNCSKVYF